MIRRLASGSALICLSLWLAGCASSPAPPPADGPENPGRAIEEAALRDALKPVSAPEEPAMTNGGMREWADLLYERLGEANSRILKARDAAGLE